MELIKEFQEQIGYEFKDESLLRRVLFLISYANERHWDKKRCNERLEFLGDAVLEVHISQGLYERFPAEREGGMPRLRSRLVSKAKLAELARGLNLGHYLHLGRGEEDHARHQSAAGCR